MFSKAMMRTRRCISSASVNGGTWESSALEGKPRFTRVGSAPPSVSHLERAIWRWENAPVRSGSLSGMSRSPEVYEAGSAAALNCAEAHAACKAEFRRVGNKSLRLECRCERSHRIPGVDAATGLRALATYEATPPAQVR